MVIHAISLVDVIEAYLSENKVFQLPKTLFIQVLFFIHPGVCFYSSRCLFLLYMLTIGCTITTNTWMNKKKHLNESFGML